MGLLKRDSAECAGTNSNAETPRSKRRAIVKTAAKPPRAAPQKALDVPSPAPQRAGDSPDAPREEPAPPSPRAALRGLLARCAEASGDAGGYTQLVRRLRRVKQSSAGAPPSFRRGGSAASLDSMASVGSAASLGDGDAVRRLERALRRSPRCRRAGVRVVRLRSAEDLHIA